MAQTRVEFHVKIDGEVRAIGFEYPESLSVEQTVFMSHKLSVCMSECARALRNKDYDWSIWRKS